MKIPLTKKKSFSDLPTWIIFLKPFQPKQTILFFWPYINYHAPLTFHKPYENLMKILKNVLTPLDHGGPEMKFTDFHRNC